jgi:hypothetical protein
MAVIDAHRAAEKHEARDVVEALGDGVALIDANQLPCNPVSIEIIRDSTRVDPVFVAKNADGLHSLLSSLARADRANVRRHGGVNDQWLDAT